MILITKVKNYKKINKELLKLIEKIKNPYLAEGNSISNTDWNLPQNYTREYLPYFYEIIKSSMHDLAFKLHSKNWTIHSCWFQQYYKSNHHDWHTHQGTNFTNVYFIELPNSSLATEIYEHENLKLKEGDLLTFPGFFYHRSPINRSNKRKTIISFNSSFNNFNK